MNEKKSCIKLSINGILMETILSVVCGHGPVEAVVADRQQGDAWVMIWAMTDLDIRKHDHAFERVLDKYFKTWLVFERSRR